MASQARARSAPPPVVHSSGSVTIAPQPSERARQLAQQRVHPHLHALRPPVVAVDAALEREADRRRGPAARARSPRGRRRRPRRASRPGSRRPAPRRPRRRGRGRRGRARRRRGGPARPASAASGAPNCSRERACSTAFVERAVGEPGEVGERDGAPRAEPLRIGLRGRRRRRAACPSRRASARAPLRRPGPRRGGRGRRSASGPPSVASSTRREGRDGAAELDPARDRRAEQLRIAPELAPADGGEPRRERVVAVVLPRAEHRLERRLPARRARRARTPRRARARGRP